MVETRRQWLRMALASAVVLPVANAWSEEPAGAEKLESPWLELTNTHTGEGAKETFRDAKGYVDEALRKFQHVLRDHRSNEAHEMDPALFDQLSDLAAAAKVAP